MFTLCSSQVLLGFAPNVLVSKSANSANDSPAVVHSASSGFILPADLKDSLDLRRLSLVK